MGEKIKRWASVALFLLALLFVILEGIYPEMALLLHGWLGIIVAILFLIPVGTIVAIGMYNALTDRP